MHKISNSALVGILKRRRYRNIPYIVWITSKGYYRTKRTAIDAGINDRGNPRRQGVGGRVLTWRPQRGEHIHDYLISTGSGRGGGGGGG
jgi:hypothetical protein